MYDEVTGALKWPVDTTGYEIVEKDDLSRKSQTDLEADFYRPEKQEEYYAQRGIVRSKGGDVRYFTPMSDTPGLARRLAGLFDEDPLSGRPTDEDILDFVDEYGLLVDRREMPVRDLIYTAKYLYLFALSVDAGDRQKAREFFNERVRPRLTVRLVGSATGRPTAKWSLEPRPTSLISAAWMQMAQELTHGKKLKKCEAPDCLEWFPDRANKRFCKNRCKMAFHRMSRQNGTSDVER